MGNSVSHSIKQKKSLFFGAHWHTKLLAPELLAQSTTEIQQWTKITCVAIHATNQF